MLLKNKKCVLFEELFFVTRVFLYEYVQHFEIINCTFVFVCTLNLYDLTDLSTAKQKNIFCNV